MTLGRHCMLPVSLDAWPAAFALSLNGAGGWSLLSELCNQATPTLIELGPKEYSLARWYHCLDSSVG